MNKTLRPLRLLAFLVGLTLCRPAAATPTVVQSLTINPGWNAIYVEVLPETADLDSLLDVPEVHSVWTYDNATGSPEFSQDVSEQALAKAGWHCWVPSDKPNAFQNDLFRLQANRAYLIRYVGTTATTLSLVGRPSLRRPVWQPDALNLRGFPVDPSFTPTFLSFFKPSSAHYSAATGLQPIYRLSSAGEWQLVAPTDLMQSGEALWVYCKGNSSYQAPLTVTPLVGDGLDFGLINAETGLTLQNLSGAPFNATIADLAAPADNPLSYAERAADATLTWPDFLSPLVRTMAAGATLNERIAIRRASMAADLYETVVQVTDGYGTRILLPVSAQREPEPAPLASLKTKKGKSGVAAIAPDLSSHVGLWVGGVTLNAVSEAHSGTLVTNITFGYTIQLETNVVTKVVTTNKVPNSVTRTDVSMATTPTGSEFRLRLLLHVDNTGQTRLLKDVIQMWKDGVTSNDSSGVEIVLEPGRPVLVTDETKISQFKGISSKDGTSIGRRLSTAAFDFTENELPMNGDFAIGSTVRGTNTMSSTFARNPFKHRYHPDHGQGFDIKRVIELQISPPPSSPPPGYGDRVLDGTYKETVTGLHRTNIVVTGVFRLNRMSTTGVLNQ